MNALFKIAALYPVEGEPILDAGLLVEKNQIKDFGSWNIMQARYPRRKVTDLSSLSVLPGFVNAHAHLELTSLRGKIRPRDTFLEWGMQVMKCRASDTPSTMRRSIQQGLDEMIRNGCTTVADYSAEAISYPQLKKSGLRGVCYYEVLQFDVGHLTEEQEKMSAYLKKVSPQDKVQKGLAMHAPYSVHPRLIRWCAGQKVPLSIHLSELKDEVSFIKRYSLKNPFHQLHKQLGRDVGGWTPKGLSPTAHVQEQKLKQFMAVHMNYVSADDIQRVKKMKATVVYCPLSHKYFKHPRHPLTRFLKEGVAVGLGTDSCASNRHLDMRQEMKHVRQTFPKLSDRKILELATLGGAQALGLSPITGSIKKGKKADLQFMKLHKNTKKALTQIVSRCPQPQGVMCDGKWLVTP